ncbi:hypothetical protein STEG23_026358, partial [Scotinomys teguina]
LTRKPFMEETLHTRPHGTELAFRSTELLFCRHPLPSLMSAVHISTLQDPCSVSFTASQDCEVISSYK